MDEDHEGRSAYPNLCVSGKPPTNFREFGAKSGIKRDEANYKKKDNSFANFTYSPDKNSHTSVRNM